MELYIPPPSSFLPRLPPPRPVVPAVPVVPLPDLPEVVHAPEGGYVLNPSLFPSIGTPSVPIMYDQRHLPSSTFMAGAGFILPPPMPAGPLPGQTAMSFGSTIVNGQTQPAWPVKMTWISVYFPPPKGQAAEKGLGGLLGMGGREGAVPLANPTYEPSVASDDSSGTSDNPPPPTAIEVPLSALPQQTSGKKLPFSRTTVSTALPRPKNNLRSSNSTFVTRLQASEWLPKLVADRSRPGGETVRWGFWNLGRTFGWGEEGTRTKEPLSRVTFSQVPTCHAVSHHTAAPDRLDNIVGFASGDLVWLDFIVGRYTRINKGGLLNATAVISVHFDPRHPHYFIAAFTDSTILRCNIFAEDPVLATIANSPMPWTSLFDRQNDMQEPVSPSVDRRDSMNGDDVHEDAFMSWKNEDFGNLADISKKGKGEERGVWVGRNPIGAYKVGRKGLTALAYSPDGTWMAVVSEDGMLRLVDVQEERLSDTFAGYFGPMNCVTWSPDSRFIAVGGQDDLITIYSPRESRVVARCQGHSAFVTAIAFDYSRGGGYRFGSVGEDGKLVLWDFTAAQLHRPRHHQNAHLHRSAAGSTLSLANQSRSNLPLGANATRGRHHTAPLMSEVALLQPVMARMVEGNLLTGIHFTSQAIYTISRAAILKPWQRPPRQASAKKRLAIKMQQSREGRGELRSPRAGEVAVAA